MRFAERHFARLKELREVYRARGVKFRNRDLKRLSSAVFRNLGGGFSQLLETYWNPVSLVDGELEKRNILAEQLTRPNSLLFKIPKSSADIWQGAPLEVPFE